MSSFTDSKGRTHTISISIGIADDIKIAIGLDLLGDREDVLRQLGGLSENGSALAHVLHIASECDLDQKDFAYGLGGDALADGWRAFNEALVHFFLKFRPQMAVIVRELMLRAEESQEEMNQAVAAALSREKVGPLVQRELNKARKEMDEALAAFGEMSSNSRDSSESTPAP